jgi:hypothetical protein
MKKALLVLLVLLLAQLLVSPAADAQSTKFRVGGHMGISIGSAAGASSAGFHFGPMFEAIFSRSYAVGSELNINTQTGTPVEWGNYFKYYISLQGSKIRPFVDGGFGLWFATGGPYFGLRFGGGATFPIAKNMYIDPDIYLGPVFTTGTTTFAIVIRGGFRYELP